MLIFDSSEELRRRHFRILHGVHVKGQQQVGKGLFHQVLDDLLPLLSNRADNHQLVELAVLRSHKVPREPGVHLPQGVLRPARQGIRDRHGRVQHLRGVMGHETVLQVLELLGCGLHTLAL